MKDLTTLNHALLALTKQTRTIKDGRVTMVNDIIYLIITESKAIKDEFATKRAAQKWIIEELTDDNSKLDTYTKRTIALAKKLLVDKYIINKKLLTLARAEKLVRCNKSKVNDLKELEGDDYIEACKQLIREYEVSRALKSIESLGAEYVTLAKAIRAKKDNKKFTALLLKALQ